MYYTTITSKGQLTVPIEFRRALGIVPGQKVSISMADDAILLKNPGGIDAVRVLLQEEMRRKGTLHTVERSGDGWAAHIAQDHAES